MIRAVVAAAPDYAAWATAARGYRGLTEDLRARLLGAGAGQVRALVEDPSRRGVFAAIVDRTPRLPAGPVALLGEEQIAGLPQTPDAREAGYWLPRLDRGLSPREAVAVGRALESETNPKHLGGFGSTFEPYFPVAATMLRARAERASGGAVPPPGGSRSPLIGAEEVRSIRGGVVREIARRKLPADVAFGEVRRAICRFGLEDEADPALPQAVHALAASCMRAWEDGTATADRGLVEIATPSTGEEGYVSPSALQLALAMSRPASARVWDQAAADRVLSSLDQAEGSGAGAAGGEDAYRARLALEKAVRTLDRQRWVRWYERNA